MHKVKMGTLLEDNYAMEEGIYIWKEVSML